MSARAPLSGEDLERYARQLSLPSFGLKGMRGGRYAHRHTF